MILPSDLSMYLSLLNKPQKNQIKPSNKILFRPTYSPKHKNSIKYEKRWIKAADSHITEAWIIIFLTFKHFWCHHTLTHQLVFLLQTPKQRWCRPLNDQLWLDLMLHVEVQSTDSRLEEEQTKCVASFFLFIELRDGFHRESLLCWVILASICLSFQFITTFEIGGFGCEIIWNYWQNLLLVLGIKLVSFFFHGAVRQLSTLLKSLWVFTTLTASPAETLNSPEASTEPLLLLTKTLIRFYLSLVQIMAGTRR